MKTQRGLWYLIILILLGVLYFFITSCQFTQRADTAFNEITHTHKAIKKITALQSAITSAESDIEEYSISGNKTLLHNIESKQSSIKNYIQELKKLTIESRIQQGTITKLEQFVNEKQKFQQDKVSIDNPLFKLSPQIDANLKENNITDSINYCLDAIQEEQQQLLHLQLREERTITHKRFLFLVLTGCGTFMLLTFTLFRVYREKKLRQVAEQDASTKEERYKGLIENMPILAFTTNLNGNFTYISNKCSDITGYEVAELLGLRFTCLVDESQTDWISDFYYRQLENRIPDTVLEFSIRSKDGIQKWVEQNVVLLWENNTPVGFQSIVKDISERKYAEKLIQEAEQKMKAEQENYQLRLQAILDNIPMIVYIKDLEGRYMMVNKRFRETLGKTDEMILGKFTTDLISDEKAIDHYTSTDQLVMDTLKDVETEVVINTGEVERNILMTKFPLFDKANQLFGICGIDKDITEMVRNRQQLVSARIRAEKAEKFQEEFLANMSHEIRTPMNGIIGMTNMLMDSPLNAEQKDFVQLIKYSSDALLVLINDVLDLSKIKAGRMSMEHIDFSIREVIDQIVTPMQLKTSPKGVFLSTGVDEAIPPYVKGDQHKLVQILNNLVSNAVKFTEAGTISVQAKVLDRKADSIQLEFSITDTGIGIAHEHLDSIFENFVQAGDDMVRRFGGTGLGLTITKRLLELQGGTIEVTSTVGQGTCFRFEITFLMSEKQAGSASPILENLYATKQALAGKRILLVEDNPINQRVTLHILKRAKMHVEIANNGKEAIAKLEQGFKFHLIIMDLRMPEMDGFQTATYIRKKLNIHTPIIAMTASALRNEKTKCFEVGMNEYMTKPFVPADLFKQLHRFLEQDNLDAEEEEFSVLTSTSNDLYNLSYILEMEDDDYFIDILTLFLETTPALLNEIHENTLHENWEDLYKSAHKLKSSLGILQMNAMLNQIAEIEMLAREESQLEKINSLIKNVIKDYSLIKPMIEADLNKVLPITL